NPENGGVSGADAQAKPKKKRNFKEDQYDVDDDFVDDSELLWEAQAAASRDGFFVYSGPLVPEVEKPAAGHDERPKRGRGGRGSRGGARGGATRGGATTGRGGGPGSRGGAVTRKPRITKTEKAQREKEKAERESMAKASANGFPLQPTTPSLSVRELGS
ncbi:HPC2-domain-containing protein, partial [Trichoderma longibrachiatum ATCC 18648]